MKNKKILLFSLTAFLSGSSLMAQTGQNWKTVGNSLTAAGKLGTTNLQDLQFISNNVVNGVLNKNGRWGFGTGTALPAARLHVNSASGEDALRVQVNNSTKLLVTSTGGVTIGSLNNGPVNGLFVSGNTGLGTSTPLSKLHVRLGSSGTTPFFQSVITAENSTNAYINLLAPKANESGILFGTSANNVDGGIIYNSTFASSALNGLQFRTNGNFPRMILNKDGLLNVGPGKNEDYRVRIDNRDVLGLDIANSAANTDWEIFADDDGLFLFSDGGAGGPAGVFDRVTGVYTARPFDNFQNSGLQNNVKPMSNVLEKISQLKASSFQLKTAKSQQEYNGFGAQEVMKVFPSLVKHHVNAKRKFDMYTIDYNGFGVIAIKGIQELMKQNEEKDTRIDALQKQIDELKAIVLKDNISNAAASATINTFLTDASLEQNVPNPVLKTTSIGYNIPSIFSLAQILITDKTGKKIKQLSISAKGKGVVNVDASALSAGTYNYSLVVDGKLIGSKQMVIAR